MDTDARDAEHLRLLRIGHFVAAGLAALGIAFLGAHYLFMRTIMRAAEEDAASRGTGGGFPQALTSILPWIYVTMAVVFAASLVLNLISAACIARRRARMFSLVVAGLNCTHAPLGTALGVLTILVLSRESVRVSYKS